MSGGINTQSLLWQRPKRGRGGQRSSYSHPTPPLSSSSLGWSNPSLACPSQSPNSSAPPPTPHPQTITNPPTHPPISSLSKTARLHYLSVTMLLFGNHERGCGDVDAKPPCTWFLSCEWTGRVGGRRQRWVERERDWEAAQGWDRGEKNNVKGSFWEIQSSYYLLRPGHSYVRRNNAARGQTLLIHHYRRENMEQMVRVILQAPTVHSPKMQMARITPVTELVTN